MYSDSFIFTEQPSTGPGCVKVTSLHCYMICFCKAVIEHEPAVHTTLSLLTVIDKSFVGYEFLNIETH
jgi:hypothetical protein